MDFEIEEGFPNTISMTFDVSNTQFILAVKS